MFNFQLFMCAAAWLAAERASALSIDNHFQKQQQQQKTKMKRNHFNSIEKLILMFISFQEKEKNVSIYCSFMRGGDGATGANERRDEMAKIKIKAKIIFRNAHNF